MRNLVATLLPVAALSAGLLYLAGCSSESGAPPLTKVVITNSAPPPASPATNAVEPAPPAPVAMPEPPADQAPTATVAAQRIPLPKGAGEVADMAAANVGETIILDFIKTSTMDFDLTADQIVYLKDIGLSDQVVAAMVKRGGELRGQPAAPAEVETAAANPPAESAAPAEAEAPPAPALAQPAPAAEAPAAPVYANATAAPAPAPSAPAPAAENQPVYAQPVTQVTQNYFYSALSPYGNWVELPPYGWCWQPSVAVVDPYWVPYCHGGRWVYTDCGWYWQSSYSWGWAAFHYGNWYRSPRCGWVWVPGYTWAPAWVTWRYTDAYCGWAPLPPGCGWTAGVGLSYWGSGVGVSFGFNLGWDCFTFVGYRHFCDPHPHRYRPPRHEVAQIYNHSTVINNYVVNNNTVINHGIAPSRISAVTRSEIRKVPLHDVTREANAPRRADRLEANGSRLAVYRPQPSAPRATPVQVQPASRHSQEARPPTAVNSAPSARGTASVPARTGNPVTRPAATTPARDVSSGFADRPSRAEIPATAGGGASRTEPAPASRGSGSSIPSREVSRPAAATPSPATGARRVETTVPQRTGGQAPSAPAAAQPNVTAPVARESATVPRASQATREPAPSRSEPQKATPVAPTTSGAPKYSNPAIGSSAGSPNRNPGAAPRVTPLPEIQRSYSAPVPSAPQRGISAPSVPRGTMPSTPSQGYTAPSRPTYSAPATPGGSGSAAPRYSAPAPSTPAPRSAPPAPSGSSSSGNRSAPNNPRNQPQ